MHTIRLLWAKKSQGKANVNREKKKTIKNTPELENIFFILCSWFYFKQNIYTGTRVSIEM